MPRSQAVGKCSFAGWLVASPESGRVRTGPEAVLLFVQMEAARLLFTPYFIVLLFQRDLCSY